MPAPRMRGLSQRLVRLTGAGIIVLTLSASLAPAASASLELRSGQMAVVVDPTGEPTPVNLRAKPRTSGDVLSTHWEGSTAEVLEGPIWDDAGIAWYKVVVDGTRGYMAADFLDIAEGSAGGEGGSSDGGELDPVTGSATIVNTGGDPINCRAGRGTDYSVVTQLTEGDAVELTGDARGSWQPVRCGGTGGFVHTDYVGSDGTGGGSGDDSGGSAEATQTVRVQNTGGDPINLRSKPRTSASILNAFGEGTRADVLEGPIVDDAGTSWYKVVIQGTRGYMAAEFLGLPAGSGGGSGGGGGGSTVTGTGTISGTNGDGARCRSKASTNGSIITVLSEGTAVDLRGDVSNGWQPVRCDGRNGFVSAEYVTVGGTTPDPDDDDDVDDGGFAPGTTLMVSATNGDGVRLRSRASSNASILTVVPEGSNVEVRRGSTGQWIAVRHAAGNGFMHRDFLEVADEPTNPPIKSVLDPGDHGLVTSEINFRARASFDSSVIAVAKENTVVEVLGGPTNGFYKVTWVGQTGYMHSDYLMWTDQDVSTGDGVGGPGDPDDGPADDGDSTAMGRKMVRYAERYLGYPYVWATHGPNTFDCSGFTYWVSLKTAGIDIGAGTWSQSVSGRPVAFGSLQPGDLVFFQNTYTWGLSHVGMYIGDGKFIHAENEQTGIVISDLNSPYYKTRWFGARRVI